MAKELIPKEIIERKILLIRGHKVMLDRDLAELYGVSTKALNQAVKRNIKRFPDDFMFKLTKKEKDEVVTNCDRFKPLKHSTALPYAFTEHGAFMLANVIKSATAIEVSILVVRAFARLREIVITHKDLQRKVEDMEKKYDGQFRVVFKAIKQLMSAP
jgi:hypothetical protein